MGTTKIWTIKDSISRVLDYASNPNKTIYSDLKEVLHYAGNKYKTESEEMCFVTGVNCHADTALEEMERVKRLFNKEGGNVAYHAYQSFKTGEVSTELCHEIGVELARRMWGTDYQVLVATHLDTCTLHNHFVVNSVNMWNGYKFNCNKKAYEKFRELSDNLCREYGLTVIEKPLGKTPRQIYFAEKRGDPTTFNLMREAIDFAIEHSVDIKSFHQVMREQGYEVNLNRNRKYWTIKPIGGKKATRMFRLGEEYNHRRIQERIENNLSREVYWNYRDYMTETKPKYIRPRPVTFKGSFRRTRKVTGLKALYLYYCYRLGYLPKKKQHRPLSPEMREAWRRIDRYSRSIRLIAKHDFKNTDDVQQFIEANDSVIKELMRERNKIYRRIYRTDDNSQKEEYRTQCKVITSRLTALRKDNRTAKNIIEDSPKIKEDIAKEERAMQQRFIVQHRNRNYNRLYERSERL